MYHSSRVTEDIHIDFTTDESVEVVYMHNERNTRSLGSSTTRQFAAPLYLNVDLLMINVYGVHSHASTLT